MDVKGRAIFCMAGGHSALLFTFQALLIIPIPISDFENPVFYLFLVVDPHL